MKVLPKVYFRADGNHQIGLGHLYRSLAMASFIQDDYDCTFIIYKPADAIRQIILNQNISLIELQSCDYGSEELSSEIKNLVTSDDVIVLDGYKFTDAYQSALKNVGCVIIYIDDLLDNYQFADAVINHAGGVSCNEYAKRKNTNFYLGAKYALIKKDFFESRTSSVESIKSDKIFICLGGADPENFTLQIVNDLIATGRPFEEIHIVTGASYLHGNSLKEIGKSRNEIKIHSNLDSMSMSKLMQQCAIAITAASTIAYEYCYVGGLLFLLQTADNQKRLHDFLISENLAYPFSQLAALINTQNLNELRRTQIEMQRQVFDGLAPERIKNIVNDAVQSKYITFRFAEKSDISTYFEWANDTTVRSQAYNTEQIKWDDHIKWFETKLSSQNTIMYIFQVANENLGQVRFDTLPDKTAIIDYSIDGKFRGKGYGIKMLQMAINTFKGCYSAPLVAHVKAENMPSRKIFEHLKFQVIREEQHMNESFIIYEEKQ